MRCCENKYLISKVIDAPTSFHRYLIELTIEEVFNSSLNNRVRLYDLADDCRVIVGRTIPLTQHVVSSNLRLSTLGRTPAGIRPYCHDRVVMMGSLSVLLGHVDKYELDTYRGKGRPVYIHIEGRKDLGRALGTDKETDTAVA